jgi:hypothetical protein
MQQQVRHAVKRSMHPRSRLAPLAITAAVLCIAGCGSGGAGTGPKVGLSITAPTSGATVGVQQVVVAGTVSPATATVLVAGKPAPVIKGSFQRSLHLASPTQTITVTAQANGYTDSSTHTTVSYSSKLAAELLAAKTAASKAFAVHFATAAQVTKATPRTFPGANPKAVNSAFRLPSQSGTTPPSKPTTPTTPATPTKPTTPSSGGAPTSPAPLSPDQIRQLWEHGCLKHVKGENVVPWCTCIYVHLQSTGAFNSRDSVRQLIKEFDPWSRTGETAALPQSLRTAVTTCQQYLPPLDPITGKPVVTRLPGLSHKPVPAPTPTEPAPH